MKTYKNSDGSYTTYHDNGNTSVTQKNVLDGGYTTYHSDGSTTHTYPNILDDGYTSYHETVSGGNNPAAEYIGIFYAILFTVFAVLFIGLNFYISRVQEQMVWAIIVAVLFVVSLILKRNNNVSDYAYSWFTLLVDTSYMFFCFCFMYGDANYTVVAYFCSAIFPGAFILNYCRRGIIAHIFQRMLCWALPIICWFAFATIPYDDCFFRSRIVAIVFVLFRVLMNFRYRRTEFNPDGSAKFI